MARRLAALWQWRGLIRTLVGRDLLARYKGSTFGVLWSLMHPIALATVYTVAFRYVIRIQIPHYPLFLLAGLLPWLFFSTSLTVAAGSIVDQGQLVKKVAFPREVLPLSAVFSQLVHFAVAYIFVVPAVAMHQGLLSPVYVVLPAIMFLQVLFTCGFAVTIAVAQVYLRDVRHMLEVGLQILFWATPVVYSLNQIDARFHSLAFLNPLTVFAVTYQQIIVNHALPSQGHVAALVTLALGSFIAGYAIFLRGQARVAEYV